MFGAIMAPARRQRSPAAAARARRPSPSAAPAATRWRQREVQRRCPRRRARARSATHGAPRAAKSVRTIERSVQRLRCVPRTAGSSTMRPPGGAQAHAELDVLDRRPRVALRRRTRRRRRTPRGGSRRGRPRTSSAGPGELAWTWWCRRLRKRETSCGAAGRVVVGAEDGGEAGVGVEALAQAAQRVGVDLDVGVDEDDDLAAAARDAGVARRGRPAARRLGDDLDRVRLVGARERGEAARQRRRVVGGGNDDGKHVRTA